MTNEQFKVWFRKNYGHSESERDDFVRRFNKLMLLIGAKQIKNFSTFTQWMYGRGVRDTSQTRHGPPEYLGSLRFEQVLILLAEINELTKDEFMKAYLDMVGKNVFENLVTNGYDPDKFFYRPMINSYRPSSGERNSFG